MVQPRLDFTRRLARYHAHFPGPHLDMVVSSMLAGNTAGRLWTVQETTGPLLLLWDKGNNVFYLASAGEADASITALLDIVAGEVLPQARAEGVRRFKVRALSPALEEGLSRIFPGIALRPTITHFAVHDETRQARIAPPSLSDVTFLPITPAVLNRGDLTHIDSVREEIEGMWPSEARFNEHGFGILAVLGKEVICWCTSEYVGPTHCGIGIATAPRYQGNGVATAATGYFVQEARRRGLTACWECDSANAPSVRVAEKAGFVRRAEERYWIGFLAAHVGQREVERPLDLW